MRRSLLLASTLAGVLAIAADARADFVANFHENLESGTNTLFVFGEENTTGTVSGLDGFSQSFTIDNSGVFELGLGTRGREMTDGGAINQLSLLVQSPDPISGLALNRAGFSSDMTTLFDTDALSTEYRVLTTPGVFGSGAQMSITAVSDGTTVTVASPIDLAGNPADTPFQVTLDAGESVFYESGAGQDLSGTHITADSAVAVFGGAECTQVPVGTVACDQLIAQQVGVENFDTEYRIAKNFAGGSDGDLLRVIASTDGTEVFLNGVSQGVIDAGEVLELDNVGDGVLTASAPVMVGQFIRGQGGTRSTGDPAFAIVPSVNQELDEYAYAAPTGFDSFDLNFLNVAIDEAIAGSLLLNGDPVDVSAFTLLDGVLFGNVEIDPGFGTISASESFLATIAGFSSFDSYFSPIATAFSPGASPAPPQDPDPTPPQPPIDVPLPATLYLLAAGVLGLGTLSWRRRLSAPLRA